MKRNLRVVHIKGFRGLFFAMFIISCLIAGFIAFPAFVSMNAWNYLAIKTGSFNQITFAEGLLLWAIVAFSVFIFNKRKLIVSFNSRQELTDEEVKDVISKIKSQALDHKLFVHKDLTKELQDHKEEVKEAQIDSKE